MDTIKVGPFGGVSGSIWDVKLGDGLAGIYVSYDKDIVYSLMLLNYVNENLVKSEKCGSQKCKNCCVVIFDYPSGFLTSITGLFARVDKTSTICLSSIKFGTNKGSYGPFGTPSTDYENNFEFNFVIGNHQYFGGFHGTKSLDGIGSIGFYVKNIPSSVLKLKDNLVKVKKEKEED